MSKAKKAQGLSLNMIVVGAIGLVVLVVIITIFVSSLQKSQDDITKTQTGSECSEAGGKMMYAADCNKVGGTAQIGTFKGNLNVLPTSSPSPDNLYGSYSDAKGPVSSGALYVCCKE